MISANTSADSRSSLNWVKSGDTSSRIRADWSALASSGSQTSVRGHGTELLSFHGDTLTPEQELVHDLLSTLHVFSAPRYGLRSCKKAIRDAALHQGPAPNQRG